MFQCYFCPCLIRYYILIAIHIYTEKYSLTPTIEQKFFKGNWWREESGKWLRRTTDTAFYPIAGMTISGREGKVRDLNNILACGFWVEEDNAGEIKVIGKLLVKIQVL